MQVLFETNTYLNHTKYVNYLTTFRYIKPSILLNNYMQKKSLPFSYNHDNQHHNYHYSNDWQCDAKINICKHNKQYYYWKWKWMKLKTTTFISTSFIKPCLPFRNTYILYISLQVNTTCNYLYWWLIAVNSHTLKLLCHWTHWRLPEICEMNFNSYHETHHGTKTIDQNSTKRWVKAMCLWLETV